MFFCSLNLIGTLDDDLFGTRAADNQVKTLSARKADKEGHSEDAIADALFRVVLGLRFRRREELHTESVRKLLITVLDERGEEALNGCIIAADRGYGKDSFLEILSGHGLSSIFVMPEHLIRCHPFVAQSLLDVSRNNLEEEFEANNEIAEAVRAGTDEIIGTRGFLANDVDGGRNVRTDQRFDVGERGLRCL